MRRCNVNSKYIAKICFSFVLQFRVVSATDSLSVCYNLALFKGIAYKLLLTDRRSFFIIVGIRVFLYSPSPSPSFSDLLSCLISQMHILSFDHHYVVDNLHLVIAWCSFNKFEKMRSRKWSVFLSPIADDRFGCVCMQCICIVDWTLTKCKGQVPRNKSENFQSFKSHTLYFYASVVE